MGIKIEIKDAGFRYTEEYVWQDINLSIEEGETVSLLGPNGCGKTTLLNCIHGALTLENGKITIDNRDIRSMSIIEIARKIGIVFQEHQAPFPYTALETVTMGRAPHLKLFQSPAPQDFRYAEKIMYELDILHLRDKRYTHISGGERQLVLIARTLCQDPEIILFDEPTSHLDFKNQAVVLETIQRLSERGLTIIMTSHFPNHAWLLTSRVAMMNSHSGLQSVGRAEEVMTEENLSHTYGIRVKVYKALDGNREVNFCTPVLGSGNGDNKTTQGVSYG